MHRLNRVSSAGIVLGIGLGGFVDGIVLHMILQWHHMLSHVLPPDSPSNLYVNMVWDGYFHAGALLITLVGIFMLWGATRSTALGTIIPSTRSFIGALIAGWGLFNLIEGIIDHHLLVLHNVREVSNPAPWNIGFLVIGGWLFLVVGWVLMRAPKQQLVTVTEHSRVR